MFYCFHLNFSKLYEKSLLKNWCIFCIQYLHKPMLQASKIRLICFPAIKSTICQLFYVNSAKCNYKIRILVERHQFEMCFAVGPTSINSEMLKRSDIDVYEIDHVILDGVSEHRQHNQK